jgi:hypothetical protein
MIDQGLVVHKLYTVLFFLDAWLLELPLQPVLAVMALHFAPNVTTSQELVVQYTKAHPCPLPRHNTTMVNPQEWD